VFFLLKEAHFYPGSLRAAARCATRGHEGRSPLQRTGKVEQATDWLLALGYSPIASAEQSTVLKDEERLVAWHSHCQVHLNHA
jgi:hypothetical protein